MSENAIVVQTSSNSIVRTMDDAERAARAMASSGYFQDSREAAQCLVKILAGQEMGFGPFAAMTGVYVISGRPAIGANLMAAAIKRSGRYNYRVLEMTTTVCRIEILENGKPAGVSEFTIEDARKAGTKNLDKFARNMLFARAISNAVRWFCPDVFNGSAAYTPEELGASVDEDGEVIDVQPTPPAHQTTDRVEATPVVAKVAPAPMPVVTYEQACLIRNSAGELYGTIDSAKLEGMQRSIEKRGKAEGVKVAEKDDLRLRYAAIDVILSHREDEQRAEMAQEMPDVLDGEEQN